MTLFSKLVQTSVYTILKVTTIILLVSLSIFSQNNLLASDLSSNKGNPNTIGTLNFHTQVQNSMANNSSSKNFVMAKYSAEAKNIKETQIDSSNLATSISLDKDLPILMYHHIREIKDLNEPLAIGLSVTPENFEKQIMSIQKEDFKSVLYKNLLAYMMQKDSLPLKPIMLNFDDGYSDAYTNAFPILEKYHIKASFAIITDSVGNEGYMTWDQIRDLKAHGHEIVSHTVSHPDLEISDMRRISYELHYSKLRLDLKLGQDTNILVYPSGKYDSRVVEIAKQEGYLLARSTSYGKNINVDNIYHLSVIRMLNDMRNF
jgi:peptidoglycan/xylan/chitin deacetylase (PgdA/CDA1 family)